MACNPTKRHQRANELPTIQAVYAPRRLPSPALSQQRRSAADASHASASADESPTSKNKAQSINARSSGSKKSSVKGKNTNKSIRNRHARAADLLQHLARYARLRIPHRLRARGPHHAAPLVLQHRRRRDVLARSRELGLELGFIGRTDGFGGGVGENVVGLQWLKGLRIKRRKRRESKDAYDKLLFVESRNGLAGPNLFVHERLSERRLIQFIVSPA